MTFSRIMRTLKLAIPSATLFQMTGCDLTGFFDVVQTVFLGISAAGAIAILQNI